MTNKPFPHEPEIVECEVCLKEIPASAAQTMEVKDYVHHFCGLECFRQWREKYDEQAKF